MGTLSPLENVWLGLFLGQLATYGFICMIAWQIRKRANHHDALLESLLAKIGRS